MNCRARLFWMVIRCKLPALPQRKHITNHFSTSPSVYARFNRIHAYDGCGQTTIPPMMLSFAPGELSTIVGPISIPAQLKRIPALFEKKPFNPRDLPCPPQDVMVQPQPYP